VVSWPCWGAHGGHGDGQGGVGYWHEVAARWGLVLGFCRGGDHPLGVEGGGWSKEREREAGYAGVWPWAPLPPSIQPDTTREKGH
jgi:hypothetical protein